MSRAEKAERALAALAELAADKAGSKFTLAEVFGTFHRRPEIEGVLALEVLDSVSHFSGRGATDARKRYEASIVRAGGAK